MNAEPVTRAESPREVAVIRQQLAELEGIQRSRQNAPDIGFAGTVDRLSLEKHEQELREELHAAELLASNASAEFALAGEPVPGHEVAAGVLGEFLSKLQSLVYAVGQAVEGRSTPRAPFPQRVMRHNRLLVQQEFVAGSFGFRVRTPDKEELADIFDSGAEDVLQTVCDALAEDEPSKATADLLTYSRVKTHYKAVMDLLAKQNADVRVRHRSQPFGRQFTSSQARERIDWLDLLSQVREETVVQAGRLVGGSIERGRFELKVDDEEQLWSGETTEQARRQMEGFRWGDNVVATIRTITTEQEETAGEPSVKYVAQRFEAAEQGRLDEADR